MNMKKVIILSLLALMVLGCISTVSAGMFDFLKATVEDNQLEQRNDLSNSFSSIIDTTSVDEDKILRISKL